MPKTQRTTQQIFAANAGSQQITAFGTAKDQTPVYTKSVAQIQNTNYSYGWSSALLPDKAPWQEDMNALFYAITTQLAYLFQEGIPEYDAGTTYSTGALAKTTDTQGKVSIIKSNVDENTGNSITDTNYWSVLFSETSAGIANYEIGLPQPTFSNTLLPNEIWLEGQAVSRTSYAKLFAIYGTTYGSGNGSTTFNLPDCRNRVLWGASDFGYISAGLPTHTHTRGTMNITGTFFGENLDYYTYTGAFYKTNIGNQNGVGHLDRDNYQSGFDASRSWTGATSEPDNSIYGASNTVQPPAIKCRVKTRFI